MSHPVASIAGAVATPFLGLPMLAQLPSPDAAQFGAWMLSLASLMVIVRQGLAIKRDMKEDFREKPVPADTYQTKKAAEASESAQKSHCAATHAALKELLDERNDRAAEDRKETKKSIDGLSERIESVLKLVLGGNRGRRVPE